MMNYLEIINSSVARYIAVYFERHQGIGNELWEVRKRKYHYSKQYSLSDSIGQSNEIVIYILKTAKQSFIQELFLVQ